MVTHTHTHNYIYIHTHSAMYMYAVGKEALVSISLSLSLTLTHTLSAKYAVGKEVLAVYPSIALTPSHISDTYAIRNEAFISNMHTHILQYMLWGRRLLFSLSLSHALLNIEDNTPRKQSLIHTHSAKNAVEKEAVVIFSLSLPLSLSLSLSPDIPGLEETNGHG